ncbi:hypothetical protein H9L39_02781 [Fusarium oxysporum f. sp. albedinis]|jgi:hypothetical protein|nr:hypothetical protein H9L39_02781 [Fusarium oxysporum f. sp. albedinis]
MAVKSDHVYVINLFKSGLSRKAKCSKENTPMGDSIRGIAIAIVWSVVDQKMRDAPCYRATVQGDDWDARHSG